MIRSFGNIVNNSQYEIMWVPEIVFDASLLVEWHIILTENVLVSVSYIILPVVGAEDDQATTCVKIISLSLIRISDRRQSSIHCLDKVKFYLQ